MKQLVIGIVMVIMASIAGCVQPDDEAIKDNIRQNIIGKELNYSTITGEIAKYQIKESDIKSIEKIAEDKTTVWKAEIGKPLRWNLYFDRYGNGLIRTEQLFQS